MLHPSRQIQASRRNCPIALAVFLIALLAVLAITFAPRGSFVTSPGVTHGQH